MVAADRPWRVNFLFEYPVQLTVVAAIARRVGVARHNNNQVHAWDDKDELATVPPCVMGASAEEQDSQMTLVELMTLMASGRVPPASMNRGKLPLGAWSLFV